MRAFDDEPVTDEERSQAGAMLRAFLADFEKATGLEVVASNLILVLRDDKDVIRNRHVGIVRACSCGKDADKHQQERKLTLIEAQRVSLTKLVTQLALEVIPPTGPAQ